MPRSRPPQAAVRRALARPRPRRVGSPPKRPAPRPAGTPVGRERPHSRSRLPIGFRRPLRHSRRRHRPHRSCTAGSKAALHGIRSPDPGPPGLRRCGHLPSLGRTRPSPLRRRFHLRVPNPRASPPRRDPGRIGTHWIAPGRSLHGRVEGARHGSSAPRRLARCCCSSSRSRESSEGKARRTPARTRGRAEPPKRLLPLPRSPTRPVSTGIPPPFPPAGSRCLLQRPRGTPHLSSPAGP